jgi:hypothetical protein
MSAFTQIATGPMSNPSTFSGSPATPPAAGDSIDLAGFSLYCDYSVAGAGLTINDTSLSDGYLIVCQGRSVKIAGLTGGITVVGSPESLDFNASGSFHARGG